MQESEIFFSRLYRLPDEERLNAHSLAVVVRKAKRFQSSITLTRNHHSYNGKSLFSMLFLSTENGEMLKLNVRGPDADLAVDEVETVLKLHFSLEAIPRLKKMNEWSGGINNENPT